MFAVVIHRRATRRADRNGNPATQRSLVRVDGNWADFGKRDLRGYGVHGFGLICAAHREYQGQWRDGQMRLLFMGSTMIILALAGLASPAAAAQKTTAKERHSYSTCNCQFGYGGSCVSALACTVEGGRCSGSCVPQPEFELPATGSGAPSAQHGR